MTTGLGTLTTYNPWTVGPTTPLDDVAARLDSLGIHHVAVVDDSRQVLGMVSESDLLRAKQRRPQLTGAETNLGPTGPYLVRDVMSPRALTLPPTAGFGDALALLVQHQIHALPVVESGRLVGIVTSRDFLRELSYGETSKSREPLSAHLRPLAEPLDPDATLDEALLAMQENGTSSLAVAQGGCPLGVVSQRDIVRAKYGGDAPASDSRVLRIVRESPTLRPGQRLCDAAAALVERGLPAVTVVNQANRLLGLVTEDDLLRLMYDEAP